MICDVLPVLPDGTVIGNWAAFRHARLNRANEVRVKRFIGVDWDDHEIALRALTSVSRKGYEDPLLLGLIYRRWRGYEDCMLSQRQSRSLDQWFRTQFAMSQREYLHKQLTRRLGCSIRELQRLALILDAPSQLLRLHRDGKLTLSVLERFLPLTPADQEDLLNDLRRGESLEELIRDFGLKPDRKERRLRAALNVFTKAPICWRPNCAIHRIEPKTRQGG